ncbi:MAG: 50S ribosomal protein L20 [Planctomycetota bacterium]
MPRITGGPKQARKRKRILKQARGYVGPRSKNYRAAKDAVRRAGAYATAHRKQKKRLYRQLWITRVSAALRPFGISYSRFIPALQAAGIDLNRKMLSEIAIADPDAFAAIVDKAKPHVHQPVAKAA